MREKYKNGRRNKIREKCKENGNRKFEKIYKKAPNIRTEDNQGKINNL